MSTPTKIVPGQRWASEAEPELGLGTVLSCEYGRIELEFRAAGEKRLFALSSAPLRRVQFEVGDVIQSRSASGLTVDEVQELNGCFVYITPEAVVPECELSDTIRFSRPEERLKAGMIDDRETYDLRIDSLKRRAQWRCSKARGYLGARIQLLPHQLATASAVLRLAGPRALLADEVGLGKTIEACLVLHRMLLTHQAERILIVVPDSLIHQWFIELLRRFNLSFSLFDEERFEEIQRHDRERNPFLEEQWIIVSQDFIVSAPAVAEAVLSTPWDMLVVDEAHHLEWSPEAASPAYVIVDQLSRQTAGLLLLTATPEQLGAAGHFARLRLLDPDRFTEMTAFEYEAQGYHVVADLVEKLETGPSASLSKKAFAKMAKGDSVVARLLDEWPDGVSRTSEAVVSRLIDAFGPGRVLFRSTRGALGGFPKRKAILHPLEAKDDSVHFSAKIRWLVDLLAELKEAKVLLIVHTREMAETIMAAVERQVRVPMGVFHEGLTLIQRDRQAAYFSDPEGARLLVCSEIGSEGRNFQFAHHLVLFDVPPAPELLEQRIGRLDRIGQSETIRLHVPYIKGSQEEAWVRWYHEGLQAFETCLPGGHGFGETFGPRLDAMGAPMNEGELAAIISEAVESVAAFRLQLADGRDRLLGVHPEAQREAEELISVINEFGSDPSFEKYALGVFDACGLNIKDLAPRRYRLAPGVLMAETLPGLPEQGMTVTFDRSEAIAREDLIFFSADHPLLNAAFDQLLGSENGNSSFAIWPDAPSDGVFLEVWFVIEVVAPKDLHVDRFLPPEPFRIVVDHTGEELDDVLWADRDLVDGDPRPILEKGAVRKRLLPVMLERSKEWSELTAKKVYADALIKAESSYDAEIERLHLLSRLNDHVDPVEVQRLEAEKLSVLDVLKTADAREDAVRLIWAQA
tara:strand:+ start:153378 stop:156125 length:2748 start_codon:yes stop_codon:yes gene_type:complete